MKILPTTLLSLSILIPTVASAGTIKEFCAVTPPSTYGLIRQQAWALRNALCTDIGRLTKHKAPNPEFASVLERHDVKGKEIIRALNVVTILEPESRRLMASSYYLAGWDARHLDRAKAQSEATGELGLTDDADLKARLDKLFDKAKELGDATAAKIPADADEKFLAVENPDRIAKEEEDFYTANKALVDAGEAIVNRSADPAVMKHEVKELEGCSVIRLKLEELYSAKKPHSINDVEDIWFGSRLGQFLFRHHVMCAAAEGDGALATSLLSRQGKRQLGGYHMNTLVDNQKLLLSDAKHAVAPGVGEHIDKLQFSDGINMILRDMEGVREKGDWSPTVEASDVSDTKLGMQGYIPPIRSNKISAIEKRPDGYYVLKSKKDKVQYPIWNCVNLSQWGWSPDGKPLFNQKCTLVKMETIVVDYGDTITHPACAAAFKVGRQIKTSTRDLHYRDGKTMSTWLVYEVTPKGPKYINYFGVDLTK